ncbi:MAG: hypothetical protein H0T62_03495 [Parachlamydiaceae bacterium]|nr:hypothetical protein [Parachlamydiaceae bacterium]
METTMNHFTPAPCFYLFNQEAAIVYPKLSGEFVNQSLKNIMGIVDHLLVSNPESLFLFDPASCNNQCHLFSLINAQLLSHAMTQQQQQQSDIKAEIPDKKFIYLSFFLSHAFLANSKLCEQVARKALQTMKSNEPTKQFCMFIKDPEGKSVRAARNAINVLFADHMKTVLSKREDPLFKELALLAHEPKLTSCEDNGPILYTLPKFAGVAYFVDAIFKEEISVQFKVKVVTKEGNGLLCHTVHHFPSVPVIVFEMVATDQTLSYKDFEEIAKKCPSFSQRNINQSKRHKNSDSCGFCTTRQINVEGYRERFQSIFERSNEMLLALGADFVLQRQKSFEGFFTNTVKYPLLTALFKESRDNIQKFCLSMDKPLSLSVLHAQPDSASFAAEDALIMDATFETHSKKRGLVLI